MPTPRFHPLIRLVFFAIGVFWSMMVAGLIAFAISSFVPSLLPATNMMAMVMTVTLLSYPLIVLWTWGCRRVMDMRSFASLGLQKANAGRDGVAGVLCGAAAIAFIFGVLLLTGFIQLGTSTGTIWSPESLDSGVAAMAGRLLLWAAAFVAVGFVEELIFRGYAFQNLCAWMGVVGASISQAIVFAIVHMQNAAPQAMTTTEGALNIAQAGAAPAALADAMRAIPSLFLIAIFFSLCYLKTGSLWFPIGFHAAWNFCLGCIFSLPVSGIPVARLLDVSVSGSSWITGGSFGPEGSMLLLPIIAAMCFVLLRQPHHPQALTDLALLRPLEVEAEFENNEPHTSRFKTSMRSRTQDLEPEVTDTLRQLSEARAARRQESPLAPPTAAEPGSGVLQAAQREIPEHVATPANAAINQAPSVDRPVPVIATVQSTPAPIASKSELSDAGAEPRVVASSDKSEAPATASAPIPSAPTPAPPNQSEPVTSQPPQPKKPPAPRW